MPAFAFPDTAKITLINLYFSRHQIVRIGDQLLGNKFPELVAIQDRCVAVDAHSSAAERVDVPATKNLMSSRWILAGNLLSRYLLTI